MLIVRLSFVLYLHPCPLIAVLAIDPLITLFSRLIVSFAA